MMAELIKQQIDQLSCSMDMLEAQRGALGDRIFPPTLDVMMTS
jgi:hypothetical protein